MSHEFDLISALFASIVVTAASLTARLVVWLPTLCGRTSAEGSALFLRGESPQAWRLCGGPPCGGSDTEPGQTLSMTRPTTAAAIRATAAPGRRIGLSRPASQAIEPNLIGKPATGQ